jgi:PBP superfamily domain
MNTLLKTSYLACSIAVALGTNAAHAVAPTTTPGLVVYSGGGSAEPQPIEAAFCRLFNNVDDYTDAAKGAVSGDYLVLYGTAINAIGAIPAGTNVLYFYKFNGGSYPNGGIPQAGSQSAAGTAQQLNYPTTASVLSGTLITAGTQGTVCTAAQKGLPTFAYTANVNNPQLPDFGITDVEVSLFAGVNNPTTLPLVSVGSPSLVYDLVEGVAVTNSLFTGVGPSGALSGINKKTNFTRAEVAGILSGNITDWHDIYADNGSPVAPAGSGIILIDRNVGSGTKAGGTSYFLGFPGLGNNALQPNSVTNLAGTGNGAGGVNGAGYGPTLQKVQTSQDVLDTSSATVVNDLATANSQGLLAIAILSVDNPPALNQSNGVNTYDFAKINGVAMDGNTSTDNINGTMGSSYINVINGSYDFFYQVNFNQRSGFSTGAPANNVAFANGLKAALQSPTLAGVNAGAQFPLATNGIVIDGDTASSLAKGVTVTSRSGVSPSAPQVVLKVAGSAIVTGNDPF